MKRDELVAALDAFFRTAEVRGDDWAEIFALVYEDPIWRDYVEPGWVGRWNGLMVKGADTVSRVATCVFPSDAIIARLAPGTFLFTEHPIDDVPGDVYAPWSRASFERLKHAGISVYTAHATLDHHPEVAPSKLIAARLGLRNVEEFLPVATGIPGGSAVIGDAEGDVSAVAAKLQAMLEPEVRVRVLGTPREAAGRVAVVSGGGASVTGLREALRRGCTTYLTGNAASKCDIPMVREIQEAFLAEAAKAGIAIIDGTHYGTEAPAQRAMLDWFRARGVTASFEKGRPERD